MIDDKYNIALQKVIENFTHYLSVNDGYGEVIYESRNSFGENSANSPDVKLINVYHKIQANNLKKERNKLKKINEEKDNRIRQLENELKVLKDNKQVDCEEE